MTPWQFIRQFNRRLRQTIGVTPWQFIALLAFFALAIVGSQALAAIGEGR